MVTKISEEQIEHLVDFAECNRHLAFGKVSGDRESQYEYYFMWKELARDLNYMGDEKDYKAAIEWQNIWSQLKMKTRAKVTSAIRRTKSKGETKTTVYLTALERRIYNVICRGAAKDRNLRILIKEPSGASQSTENSARKITHKGVRTTRSRSSLIKNSSDNESTESIAHSEITENTIEEIMLTNEPLLPVKSETRDVDDTSNHFQACSGNENEVNMITDEHCPLNSEKTSSNNSTSGDENKENIRDVQSMVLQLNEQVQMTRSQVQAISGNVSKDQSVQTKCACDCPNQAVFEKLIKIIDLMSDNQQAIVTVFEKIIQTSI